MWQIKRENATNGEHARTLGKRVTVSTMSPSPSEVNKIGLMGQQTRLRELSKPTGFNSKSEVKLETFFPGKSVETWDQYRKHFENVAEVNGWDTCTRGLQLAARLRGEAIEVQTNLPLEEQFDYASLVEALNRRYKRENSLQARNLFHTAKKTRPESDFEFSYRLRRLAREAYPKLPTEYLEDLLVQRFVKGLDDISIQRHLVMSTPQTMQEAVDVAEKLRSCDALEDRGKPKPVFEEPGSSGISNEEVLRAIKDLRLELKSGEKPDRYKSSFPMPIRRGACYRCGENGHISRECTSRSFGVNKSREEQSN